MTLRQLESRSGNWSWILQTGRLGDAVPQAIYAQIHASQSRRVVFLWDQGAKE